MEFVRSYNKYLETTDAKKDTAVSLMCFNSDQQILELLSHVVFVAQWDVQEECRQRNFEVVHFYEAWPSNRVLRAFQRAPQPRVVHVFPSSRGTANGRNMNM